MTFLGRVGGKKNAHVTATTPTPPTRTGRRIDKASPLRPRLLSRLLSCKGRSHNNEKGEDFGFGEPLSALSNRRKFVVLSFGDGAVWG